MKEAVTGVLSFVAQVVASLAWPVAVLTGVILLRRHLLALIPLVRSVKYSDVEIRFGKEVAELAKSSAAATLPTQFPNDTSHQWEDLAAIAKIRPRTAIRQAFLRLSEAMIEYARKKQIEIAPEALTMPMVVGAYLLGSGSISSEQYDLLSRLRGLLDESERAQPDSILPESAAEFVGLAFGLAASVSD
jgi:hypothetical protein